MVIGNLTRRERVFDILADIRDLHTIYGFDNRLRQLESIAESINELCEHRDILIQRVYNTCDMWQHYTIDNECHIPDDINRLHDYVEQSLRSKTIAR